MADVT